VYFFSRKIYNFPKKKKVTLKLIR